jgi:CelD/BcsL family acetyltransferase involved in cellulose biosynthesis
MTQAMLPVVGMTNKSCVDEAALNPSMSGLTLRVVSSFENTDSLRPEWDQTAAQLCSNVYMSYDWCKTWWQFYGWGRELRVFLFTAKEKLVGIIPIYIDNLGPKSFQLRVARLVGANIPPKVFDPPIQEDWAQSIWREMITQLFEHDRCDLLSLGPVSELHVGTQLLHEDTGKTLEGTGVKVVTVSQTVHTVWWVPKSMEQFFAAMPKSVRKQGQRKIRQLKNEWAMTSDVVGQPERLEQEFEDFIHLHAQQWRGKGKRGHFGSWPKGEDYNRSLVQALGKLGRVRFIRLLAHSQVVSSLYVFAFGNRFYAELSARAIGEQWQKYNLGSTGILATVEQAIAEGISRIEAGLAEYDYKRRLNGQEYAARTYHLLADSTASRIRIWVFNLLRICLLWSYYKIWYARVSPHLPERFRKPIWNLWLRFDF